MIKTEKITLWPGDEDTYLESYICGNVGNFKRKALLVIPGGGYNEVCADREGYPIAEAFLPYGYDAFVLHYSVKKKRTFPAQLIEASAAMKYIRDNAEKFGIDPAKVFAVGFSAGGHLCGSLATMWHLPEIYKEVPMEYGYNKPNGVMMIYPVVVGDKKISHAGSFINLSGDNDPSEETLNKLSINLNVDEKTCPVFLVHTANDSCVNVKNSLRMADACATNKIPFELHIYPDAPHGMALCNKITNRGVEKWDNPHNEWVKEAVEWADLL